MTSLTFLIPRHDPLDRYLSEDQYREFGPWLTGTRSDLPGLPHFVVRFQSHDEGRLFALEQQHQTVIAGAVACTPQAARELWEVLQQLRNGGLPESKPVGNQHPGNQLWAELSLINFSGVRISDSPVVSEFAAQLLRALVRQQVEWLHTSGRRTSGKLFPDGSSQRRF